VVRVVESLFPGYLFVRCGSANHLDDVRYAIGISSLLHFGRRIPTVPDGVIEELRLRFRVEEPMDLESQLQPGSEVAVAGGVFLGSRGIVAHVLPARQRVQILLDFLGRTTVAEVDRGWLAVENRWSTGWIPRLAAPDRAAAAAVLA
jgi:transcriptional antiterminator RfaH